MTKDAWKEREERFENEYFRKKNLEALNRIKDRLPRKSPITGEPMEHRAIMGVIVDQCPSSGGLWLDAGELEMILDAAKNSGHDNVDHHSAFGDFLKHLFGAKS